VAAAAGADTIVENTLNAGYVVAASQGIALARGTWVMLANPDLTVSEGFIAAMLDAARSAAPEVACLVPDIRYAANPAIVNSRGIEVDRIGIPAESEAGREADTLGDAVDVFGPSTSGCLIRREALATVGGLEPLFFAYLEDVEVAWRLRKKGFRVVVIPDAIALHEGSASTGEGSWLKAFLVARNRRALFRLHGPRGFTTRTLRTMTDVGHGTVQALSGTGTAAVRGRIAALRTRRYTKFLQASNRVIGIPDDVRVALVPRWTLSEALRRKRSASSLMTTREGLAPARSESVSQVRRRSATYIERPLEVLVDATNLKPGQGGIRTYTLGLIEALASRPDLSLVVATSAEEIAELGPMRVVPVSLRTQGVAARAVWRERNLASLARSLHVDVALTPVPELPLRRLPVPSVVVVHDVGPLVAPEFYSWPKKLRYRAFLPRTCAAATAVVCVSSATLKDLQVATGIDAARCEVIGEGPQLIADDGEPAEGDQYVLYVGSLDPRKNVATLVDAFTGADPPLPARLVICGPLDDGRASADLARRLTRLNDGGRVQHLGFVAPEMLSSLYRNATAVALPSLYEGFGLPVLEAMMSGTPVVASDIASVREVAGESALYVSRPVDSVSWRTAIARISLDDELRAELVRRGSDAATRFSWSQVGERFSDLLHRIAGVAPLGSSPTR
jgi:glycosyltransferase involved in cell wall biosynthesis/GT2 family glycosyltransferase